MKFIQRMMLSCKEAGAIVEKKLTGDVSFKERIQLKLHLKLCQACREYEKQSTLIQQMLDQMHNNIRHKAPAHLKNEIKENFR